MHKKTFSGLLLVATLAIASVPASAGILLYTDPISSAWQGALAAAGTTNTDVTFGSNVAGIFPATYTTGPLTFAGNPLILGSGTSSSLYNDYYLFGQGQVTITLPSMANVYALWFYESCSANCGSYPNSVSASSATQTSTVLSNTPVVWGQLSTKLFWGFISDAPITSITLTSNSGQVPNIAVGNLSYGTSETPEAATFILIGTGLGLIARYRQHFCSPAAVA